MIKIIHIHTDLKFISDSERFNGDLFLNEIIIINNIKTSKKNYKGNVIFYNYSPKSVRKIIERCKHADLVVLYDLDYLKSKIAISLPLNIKIAWRFFGHELYGRDIKNYLSELTQQSLELNSFQQKIKNLQKSVFSFLRNLKWGFNKNNDFSDVIKHIDYFMCYSREEYDFLLKKWTYIPEFIKLSISPTFKPIKDFLNKEKLIIIGNNRSSYNNNLDIIKIIKKSKNRFYYEFALLLNYGKESRYSDKIRSAIEGLEYFVGIYDFMTLDRFNQLYKRTCAAIFNGYRQMALGNIIRCFQFGVKLYLNKKNILMKWLRNEGFIIYDINDFIRDLESKNLSLNNSEIKHNAERLSKLINSYTVEDFQQAILFSIKKQT